MANGFKLDDVNLKDPVVDIRDPLRDPLQSNIQKPPGFFSSLRNPIELILEESLPASLLVSVISKRLDINTASSKKHSKKSPNLYSNNLSLFSSFRVS